MGRRCRHVDFSKYTLVDPSTSPGGASDPNLVLTTNNYRNTEAYDNLKVQALINELNGKTPLGDASAKVPNITAMNFQAVSVAQKLLSNASGTGGINPDGSVNPALQSALAQTDLSVKKIVDTLKADRLDKSTLVVLTAKHGQDPRIGAATLVKDNLIPDVLTNAGIGVAQATQDDVSLIWLKDQAQAAQATAVLDALAGTVAGVSISQVLPGTDFGKPLTDNRTPDLIVKLKPGYIYVGNTSSTVKRAEHGGLNPDDLDVPIILSSDGLDPSLFGDVNTSDVFTTQLAPTILEALGLNPELLDGVRLEGTQALPGAPFAVPEPATWVLMGLGLIGVGSLRGRGWNDLRTPLHI